MTTATVANMREAKAKGKRCVAFSPLTGEEYSATPGDYFWAADNEALTDAMGEPMLLAQSVTRFVDALSGEAI